MTTDRAWTDRRCFQFGPYVVDPRKRLLWRDRALIPLTSKAFEILLVLLQNRGRVVDKSELLERVWHKTSVEDNTLTRNISTLRKALEERPGQHDYILTIPGSGYQFVGDVLELEDRPEGLRNGVAAVPPADAGDPDIIAGVSGMENQAAPAPDGRRRTSMITVVMALGLALVAGTLAIGTIRLNRSDPSTPQRVLRQFTFHSGLQTHPSWSPDGRSVAYASDRSGNSDIWIQAVTNPHPVQVTSSISEDSQPDWSPDGQWLVFRSERNGGGLYVVPPRGGSERRIADFGYQPRWSADGKGVLFSSSGHRGGIPRFHVVSLDGDPPRALRPDVFKDVRPLHVDWAPNGRSVSIWGRDAAGKWTFLTSPLDAGRPITSEVSADVERRIRDAGLAFDRFVWSRSGNHLFFAGAAHETRSIWRITVDRDTLAWIDGPDRLTSGTTEDTDLALSPDGSRLVFAARSTRTRLWAFPFDAVTGKVIGSGQPVTSGGAGEQDADTPDDGAKLVYRAIRSGRQELWERTVAEGRERMLVAGGEYTRTRPRWSSDGTRLAYLRRRSEAGGGALEAAVVLFAVDKGEERLLTTPGDPAMVPTDWSSDGKWLLGGCPQPSTQRIGTCLLDVPDGQQRGARVRTLAADPMHNFFEQRFSPDQRWISFIAVNAADAGVSTVFVMPAAGGPFQAMTDGLAYDDKPHWAPDGRTIYYVSHRDGVLNVWGRQFDSTTGAAQGAPFRVTAFSTPRQMISPQLAQMQIALTVNRLFLPITETQSELWILDNVNR